jgi:hypothetical protein
MRGILKHGLAGGGVEGRHRRGERQIGMSGVWQEEQKRQGKI